MKITIFCIFLSCSISLQAQTTGLSFIKKVSASIFPEKDSILYQSIRGQVIERETQQALPAATIILYADDGQFFGTSTDVNGTFIFKKIRVGRHNLKISYVGYKEVSLSVLVSSSKDLILDIPLEISSVYLSEIKVQSLDQVAPVGGNLINTGELNRHAGNRGEAIRKVSILPGIQSADDSRNDIIIRGNSPQSVLWRIEGINIPNPNHFNIPGTAGGPVSMINDKMLANSSFYSGGFPAEYGNTTSGIFDLRFRSGDSTSHNSSVQFGLLGAELSSEGPLSSKHRSSYLFAFRRSTLSIFNKLKINVGTEAVPSYTDLSFKLNFPTKHKSTFSIFGLGGSSNIDILISQQKFPSRNFYGEKDRDQYFRTATGVVGLSYKANMDTTRLISATMAFSAERILSDHKFVNPESLRLEILKFDNDDPASFPSVQKYSFHEKRISGSIAYTKRTRQSSHISVGASYDLYFFNYQDSVRNINASAPEFGLWRTRWSSKDKSLLLQPYVQWKYSAHKIDIIAGLHSQAFSLSRSWSLAEPRISFRYHLNEKSNINAGFGLHSQIQQPYLYFYGATKGNNGNPVLYNKHVDFTRSRHSVIGYEKFFGADSTGFRLKVESYYQQLYNVPVYQKSSSFSLINTGADFSRLYPEDVLVNKGVGENYGFEITAEKAFSKGYLFLFTGSLFESKYKGSDGIWRNTDFNGKYILNTLFTREWSLRKQNIFSVGGKITTAGGRWYGEVDTVASNFQRDVVFENGTRNTKQFKPYFRADFRVSYKVNLPKVTHEIVLDLINIFNTRNVLKLTYVPDLQNNSGKVVKEYQLGTLPFFYYRFDF